MPWNVLGHDRAVRLLRQSLAAGRPSHAYLFVGSRHVGKMTLAKELAQALNCPSQDDPPCGSCSSCTRIANNLHSDIEIVGASPREEDLGRPEINIELVRALQHRASYKPYEGSHRVFILPDADHLSREAANALLKVLEEPPSNTVFVLLSSRPQLLLPTIVSRCQSLLLGRQPLALIESILLQLGVDADKSLSLARLSQGRIGWAISAARDPSLVEEWHGRLEEISSLLDFPLAKRFAEAEDLANRINRNRYRGVEDFGLWDEWLRDLLLVTSSRSDLACNQEWLPTLERQASLLSSQQVVRAIRLVGEIATHLEENVNARLALEVFMLELPVLGTPVGQSQ